MSLDTRGPLERLQAIVVGLSGFSSGQVTIGVPESIGSQLYCYLTIGAQRWLDKSAGVLQRETDYIGTFAYAVQLAEGDAELTIADALDALPPLLAAERRDGSSALFRTRLDTQGIAGAPEYAVIAGMEFRLYPFRVTITQDFAW